MSHQFSKRAFIFAFITIVVVSVLQTTGTLQNLEWDAYDWRVKQFRSDSKAHEDIAVILIDDSSLKAMSNLAGRWPWPRWVYGSLMEYMSFAQPRALLFDIIFTEKTFTDKPGQLHEDDLYLVESTISSPFAYHAGRFVKEINDETREQQKTELPIMWQKRFAIENRYQNVSVEGLQAHDNNRYYFPFTDLGDASNGLGIVDVNADSDGVYRRARLFHQYNDKHYASLSTAWYLDQNKPTIIKNKAQHLLFDELSIPVDENEFVLVNYEKSFTTYSFSGIIASLQKMQNGDMNDLLVNPFELENKIIFVGASAAGTNDLKITPLDGRMPGVFLHASIASNILNKDFLTPAPHYVNYLLIILFAFIIAFAVLIPKKNLLRQGIPLAVGSSYFLMNLLLFKNNIVLDLVAPMASVLVAWLLGFSSLLLIEGREKLRFKRMMSQYLSPAVLQTVVANSEDFAKAEVGRREMMTILFSDIRSFTSMSENMEAETVVEILNHYFSEMTDAIFLQHGTIDKFIGDAIMAFWGAPIKTEKHAEEASLAALNMVDALQKVNLWLKEKSYPTLAIGIGLHTGDAILGNIGSENKLDYTIIGDNVNLASRMEGLTKQYGRSILITETTMAAIESQIPCRIIDLVRVKGKQKPIAIYEPLINPYISDQMSIQRARKLAEVSRKMFAAYLARDWQHCLDWLSEMPEDEPSHIMRQRCQEYMNAPPAEDWDGVFTMTSK